MLFIFLSYMHQKSHNHLISIPSLKDFDKITFAPPPGRGKNTPYSQIIQKAQAKKSEVWIVFIMFSWYIHNSQSHWKFVQAPTEEKSVENTEEQGANDNENPSLGDQVITLITMFLVLYISWSHLNNLLIRRPLTTPLKKKSTTTIPKNKMQRKKQVRMQPPRTSRKNKTQPKKQVRMQPPRTSRKNKVLWK